MFTVQDKLPSMAGGEDIGDGPDLSFFDDIRFLFCGYLAYQLLHYP